MESINNTMTQAFILATVKPMSRFNPSKNEWPILTPILDAGELQNLFDFIMLYSINAGTCIFTSLNSVWAVSQYCHLETLRGQSDFMSSESMTAPLSVSCLPSNQIDFEKNPILTSISEHHWKLAAVGNSTKKSLENIFRDATAMPPIFCPPSGSEGLLSVLRQLESVLQQPICIITTETGKTKSIVENFRQQNRQFQPENSLIPFTQFHVYSVLPVPGIPDWISILLKKSQPVTFGAKSGQVLKAVCQNLCCYFGIDTPSYLPNTIHFGVWGDSAINMMSELELSQRRVSWPLSTN